MWWLVALISALGVAAVVLGMAWLDARARLKKVVALADGHIRKEDQHESKLCSRHQYEMARAQQGHETEVAALRAAAQSQLDGLRRELELKHKRELVPVARLLAERKFEDHKRKEAKRINDLLVSLVRRASALYDAKQWEQASAPLEQLVAVAQYSGMRDVEAQALYNLGKNYFKLGDIDRAEILFKQAYSVACEVWTREEKPELLKKFQQRWKETEQRALTRRFVAKIEEAEATFPFNPAAALRMYQDAATFAERHEMPLQQAAALNNAFKAYVTVGELDACNQSLQVALSLAKTHDNDPTLSKAIEHNLGAVERLIKARPFQAILAQVYENLEAQPGEDIDERILRAEAAEEVADKALKEARKTFSDDDWRVALAWDRIGLTRFAQRRYTAALPAFQRARMLLLENSTSYNRLFQEILEHIALCKSAIERQ